MLVIRQYVPLMNMYSVLVTLRLSLFAFSQLLILFKSLLACVTISRIDVPVVMFVSSAYIRAVECFKHRGRSLIYSI